MKKTEIIIKTIFDYNGIEEDKPTRKREYVMNRQECHYFLHKYKEGKTTLADIGQMVGGKDHATVLHACKTVNNLIDTDSEYRFKILTLEHLIKGKIIHLGFKKDEIYYSIRIDGLLKENFLEDELKAYLKTNYKEGIVIKIILNSEVIDDWKPLEDVFNFYK